MTVTLDELSRFACDALVASGLDQEQAGRAAQVLCFADQRGYHTHGTFALSTIYSPRLRSGRISTAGAGEVIREHGAVRLYDGRGRLGLVVGTEAVDLAADLARRYGVGVVAVRNSSHFGSAGYYTHRAAAAGVIALAMTNCGAQALVPPLGGARRLLGTNPLSAAFPTRGEMPFVLDMSTTVVATGRIREAQRQGDRVSEGWLVDGEGRTTTDPADFDAGRADVRWLGGALETGGAKGFGLALMVEMLAGALPGAAVGPSRSNLDHSEVDDNVGHFFLAIDPDALASDGAFVDRADAMLRVLVESPAASWTDVVRYPGMPEVDRATNARKYGVSLSPSIRAALDNLAADLAIPKLEGAAG